MERHKNWSASANVWCLPHLMVMTIGVPLIFCLCRNAGGEAGRVCARSWRTSNPTSAPWRSNRKIRADQAVLSGTGNGQQP